MTTYVVASPMGVRLPPGTLVRLTAAQLALRVRQVEPSKKKDHWRARYELSFCDGERIGIAGEIVDKRVLSCLLVAGGVASGRPS